MVSLWTDEKTKLETQLEASETQITESKDKIAEWKRLIEEEDDKINRLSDVSTKFLKKLTSSRHH